MQIARMNPEKLKKLQAQAAQVRIGGKGSVRRKKKVVHVTPGADEKKMQSSLKQLNTTPLAGVEEANMIKTDGTVIHFNNPKVQASGSSSMFVINGQGEEKRITDLLPGILGQLGRDNIDQLQRILMENWAKRNDAADDDDEEVPTLVENFDEVAIEEAGEKS